MRKWKASEEVQKVHESLYQPSDPNDPESDTFLALIIKTVFPSKKECIIKNATWAQSVLEAIFDENHLSPKIDVDIVKTWIEALADTEVLADTEMDLVNIFEYMY